jgi:RNA polymerase sigma factor (sigma-70 family)
MRARRDTAALYLEYGASVFRRAFQLLGNRQDAEEAVHDVFAKVLQKTDQFRGDSEVMTWLYSVTTHLCLNRLRDTRRRTQLTREHWHPLRADSAPSRADRMALVRGLLARMPEELALVLAYHAIDEMTHAEIAQVLGCSRRHVGDLIERAHAWIEREAAE